MKFTVPLCVLSAGLAMAMPAQAQLASHVSVSNVTIQLIDLDVTDGITPFITYVDPPLHQEASEIVLYGAASKDNWVVDRTTRLEQPYGDLSNNASFTSSAEPGLHLESASSITGDSLETLHIASDNSMSRPGYYAYLNAMITGGTKAFVLSPNTRIAISADMEASASVGPLLKSGYGAGATAYTFMNVRTDIGIGVGDGLSAGVFDVVGSDVQQRRVMASFDNARSETAHGELLFGASSLVSSFATPVPEPATHTLLLAGTGLVALGARRQRRQTGRA